MEKTLGKGSVIMTNTTTLWLDTIGFSCKGGWQVDTQFVHLMGSGYLIAADVPGVPVADATTTATDTTAEGETTASTLQTQAE